MGDTNYFILQLLVSTVLLIGNCHGSAVYYLNHYHRNKNQVVPLYASSLRLHASEYSEPVSGEYGLTVSSQIVGADYFMLINVPKFNLRRSFQDRCFDYIIIRNVPKREVIYEGCWSNITRSFKTRETNVPHYRVTVELDLANTILPLDGFEMVFTMAKTCLYPTFGEFRCSDGYCINSALKCDNEYNCLDGSDEFSSNCDSQIITTEKYKTIPVKVGVPTGIIIFIVLLIACRAKYRRSSQSVRGTVYSTPTRNVPALATTNTAFNTNHISNLGPPSHQTSHYPPPTQQYSSPTAPYPHQPSQFGTQPPYNPAFEMVEPSSQASERY